MFLRVLSLGLVQRRCRHPNTTEANLCCQKVTFEKLHSNMFSNNNVKITLCSPSMDATHFTLQKCM